MTWRIHSIPDALCRQFAYRESLLRLGFEDDQMLLCYGRQMLDWPTEPGEVAVTVELFVSRADKLARAPQFIITCGSVARERAQAEISECFYNTLSTLSTDDRVALYDTWNPWPVIYHLAKAITAKGIHVPDLADYETLAELRGVQPLVAMRQDPSQGGN